MRTSYWRLYYHLIWSTKGREPVIDIDRETILRRSVQASCTTLEVRCHAVGVMPDHVHVAVSIPPKVAVSDAVAAIKGSSSHALKQANAASDREWLGWQAEFGVLSFGERSLPTVIAYVLGQAEHHARGTLFPGLERIDRREASDDLPH